MMTEEKPKQNALDVFLRKSGYSRDEVWSYNPKNRTFVTYNGGKYQMSSRGEIRVLLGPATPKG